MSGFSVILLLSAGALAIGLMLFFPMRWLLTRNNPESANSPKVTASGYLQAALAVALLLVIAWFMESGNKTASVIWGLLLIGGSIWLYFKTKKKKGKEES